MLDLVSRIFIPRLSIFSIALKDFTFGTTHADMPA